MSSQRSTLQDTATILQTIGQNVFVRMAIAVIFFAVFYLVLDFPWPVMLVLAGVLYWLVGWVSAREVVPEIDHDQIARDSYASMIGRSEVLANEVKAHPRTRELALQIASSSRGILDGADTAEKLRMGSRYFQLLEDLYLPNLEMYARNENRLDERVAVQFEQEILPRLVSRAEDLKQDMYRDEQMAFASRSDMLAMDLGLLPGLDFNPATAEKSS